ncbi:winged helix-turn-helix domain-containing protein [Brucella anthropi]|uniref:winged helix-turn-helix domain-containing protein n=1 Tax=Brucella anthropi TaxID=529 RepID=UPI001F307D80|nr:winged helix-turn-helix domain-containing protein [Brucella anthropi]UVV67029.1 winged helix-turn-helix domain-containing protein [Brucella anthropi]
MNIHAASNLDIEKFRKVYALVTGGATDGERAAAKARASKIADRAGMTLSEAASKLDTPKKPKTANFFEGFNDRMEAKYPGWKAREAAARAERENERLRKCRELLKEFGSEDAIFAATEQEHLLRATLEPLAEWSEYSNSSSTYISGYAGWTCREPTPKLWEALARAYPLPTDIQGVWAEYRYWRHLSGARYAFDSYYETPIWVRAREAALEHFLDTIPARNADGFRTRLLWLEELNGRDYSRDVHEDAALISTLRADFDALSSAGNLFTTGAPDAPLRGTVQTGRRTNADKRAAVLSMLDTDPDLSDREISRRTGVSPQTVGNWRRRTVAT